MPNPYRSHHPGSPIKDIVDSSGFQIEQKSVHMVEVVGVEDGESGIQGGVIGGAGSEDGG